jgi:hypothetical protein
MISEKAETQLTDFVTLSPLYHTMLSSLPINKCHSYKLAALNPRTYFGSHNFEASELFLSVAKSNQTIHIHLKSHNIKGNKNKTLPAPFASQSQYETAKTPPMDIIQS